MGARHRWLVIAVALGIMLNPLNSSMVAVAIPAIQAAFELDYTTVSWVIFSFYISSAVAQPLMGKLSDLLGRRRIFLTGLMIAWVASLFAPLVPGFGWLIGLRVIQSIGTSMMMAVGMAIIRVHVVEKQASALAVLSMFLSGSAAIGPFIGGLLTANWGWKAIFWVNVPIALVGWVLAWRNLPQEPTPERTSLSAWIKRIDLPGMLLFAIGLTTLFVGLLSIESNGAIVIRAVGIAIAGLVLLILCAVYELRIDAPFIPLRLFGRYPALMRINIEFMLANLLFYAIFFGLPSYLQHVRGINEFQTGMFMLSLGLCSLFISPLAGMWVNRSGATAALRTSAVLMTLGALGIVFLQPGSSLLMVVAILAAFGISNGLNGVAMQAALFTAAPKEVIGIASGLFNTFRYLGTIFSSLLTGIVMGGVFTSEGFWMVGIVLTGIAVLLIALSTQSRRDSAAL